MFLFFLIFFFLTPAVIAQVFNLTAELAIPTKEAKTEIKARPVIAEAKLSVQYNLKLNKLFCASYSSINFSLFLQ